MKRTFYLFALSLMLLPHAASAYDFASGGIYYNITSETELTCKVTYRSTSYSSYSGAIDIPASVDYNGATYSVTGIGGFAFRKCSGLTSVTIPNSVTSIGEEAFSYCSGLTSITIPNSVTIISNYAFYGCSGLADLRIEDGNETLFFGAHVFSDCTLSTVYVGRNFKYTTAVSYTSDYPFYQQSIQSLIIGNSVTSIESAMFYGCSELTEVTIPNSVTNISNYAFAYCSGLTELTIPNSVTNISNYAFAYCSGLAELTIPNSVTSIGNNAFYGCSGLTGLTIPNSVTSIGSYAFYGCSRLHSVTIGSGVLSIGNYAFDNKPEKVIWLPNTPPEGYENVNGLYNYVSNESYSGLSNMKEYPYLSSLFAVGGIKYVPVSPSERTCDAIDCAYDSTAAGINIGKTVSYQGIELTLLDIRPYLCYGNSSIKTVQIAGYEGQISSYAFAYCDNIESATLGNGIESIGNYAFAYCDNLDNAILTLGNNIGNIGDYAFYRSDNFENATLGEGLGSIGQYAFADCGKLQGIDLPDSVTSIGQYCFSGCSSLAYANIGSGIKALPLSSFSGCSALASILIPATVDTISNYAFSGCTSLAYVTIADRETELTLGSNGSNPLFADCPLDTAYIGGNISYPTGSSYGYSPFYRNTSLRTVRITDKETEISENEFYGCTGLRNVVLGDGIKRIGNYAFSGCAALDNFTFGTSLDSIGEEAFSDCTSMTRLVSHTATPPVCGTQALDDINKWTCGLFVPEESLDLYKAADQWKEFFFIQGTTTALDSPASDAPEDDLARVLAGPMDVYNASGQLLKQSVRAGSVGEALSGLGSGVYILRGSGAACKVANE